MEKSARFRRNPEYIFREVVGESILVPTGKANQQFSGMATMNKTGTFLWKLLEEERTLQELSELLAQQYDLPVEQTVQDVTDFLLAAQGRGAVLSCS